jgi:hypothetical protein
MTGDVRPEVLQRFAVDVGGLPASAFPHPVEGVVVEVVINIVAQPPHNKLIIPSPAWSAAQATDDRQAERH